MAIFEIHDGRYIACFLWTAFEVDLRGDMLGMIYRDPGANEWVFSYRHRWYADRKLWDSKDRKSAYEMTIPIAHSEDEVANRCLLVWQLALQAWPGGAKAIEAPRVIWVRSDRAEDAARVLRAQSFASIKLAT